MNINSISSAMPQAQTSRAKQNQSKPAFGKEVIITTKNINITLPAIKKCIQALPQCVGKTVQMFCGGGSNYGSASFINFQTKLTRMEKILKKYLPNLINNHIPVSIITQDEEKEIFMSGPDNLIQEIIPRLTKGDYTTDVMKKLYNNGEPLTLEHFIKSIDPSDLNLKGSILDKI